MRDKDATRDNEDCQNRMYNVFENRGFIRDIEKLQDRQEVEVYKRA